ncbi:hypothetical protein [Nitrobacter hamburgensis]|uniref:hypothetical protein n=1 Tax=Nitrobacter hamburgensis TaxID=912 RepID=UPI00059E7E47|nr:hypothetical protein [Nitrobacter hamburgensis]
MSARTAAQFVVCVGSSACHACGQAVQHLGHAEQDGIARSAVSLRVAGGVRKHQELHDEFHIDHAEQTAAVGVASTTFCRIARISAAPQRRAGW